MCLKIGSEKKGAGNTAERQSICLVSVMPYLVGPSLSAANPKSGHGDLHLIMKVCPLAQACPQLALIIQIKLFLFIYVLPRGSVNPALYLMPYFFRVSLAFLRLSSSQNPLCPQKSGLTSSYVAIGLSALY